MAKVRIEFETDNAAFGDDMCGELNRVLTQAKSRLMNAAPSLKYLASETLRDSNGNTIGKVEVTE